jgi:hypothetical protein
MGLPRTIYFPEQPTFISVRGTAVVTQERYRRPNSQYGRIPARAGLVSALSQNLTTTNGYVDQSTRDLYESDNDAITILRERITTWVVVDII